MKALHILDASTDIKAIAFRLSDDGLRPDDVNVLAEAGFGRDVEQLHHHIILIALSGPRAEYDPFAWEDWTMRAAHLYLRDHFETVRHGGSIDVEALRLQMIEDAR